LAHFDIIKIKNISIMAKIQLNGKKISINSKFTVKDLIKKYRLKEKKIAIEVNGIILPKQNYSKKKLKNNDKVEVVQFIGGG
tara:strand:- start:720 stop:965 length:246 start_codon:yes stop_codon:yes gene_type:complete